MTPHLICALLLAVAAMAQERTGSSAQMHVITVRDADGQLKGAFQTRPEPYRAGIDLPLRVALPRQRSLRTEDGLIVNGFGFYGWDKAGVTHLRVLVLVPAPGVPNRYLWTRDNPNPEGMLQAREFAYYTLSRDKALLIAEMKKLGMQPMQIRLESKMPAREAATARGVRTRVVVGA